MTLVSPSGWRHYAATAALAVACMLPAVWTGRSAVRGVTQPYDLDQFRDIAAAQSIADGRFPADPDYRGETLWYNPLLPATVAALSRISGMDVASTFVHAGPVLNALAPLAFFAMAAAFLGPWPALAAFVLLLYSPAHGRPAWATPGYSPWLFVSTFAAAFFYASLIVVRVALDRDRSLWWMAVGAVLGLTFLAHTAPALVLGVCVVAASITAPRAACRSGRVAMFRDLGAALTVALLVSAPFLWSIAGHYHLHVLNRQPTDWVWAPIADWRTVLRASLTPKAALALLGAAPLIIRARVDAGARLILLWLAAALAFFAYGYVVRGIGGEWWPPLIPQFHFYFYARAAGDLLAGYAVWVLAVAAAATVARAGGIRRHAGVIAAALITVAVVAYARAGFLAYRHGPAFEGDRFTARTFSLDERTSGVRARLRQETAPASIVLASTDDSLERVAPAGRAVICVPGPFSNPYVAFEPRAAAQQRLMVELFAHDAGRFGVLAREDGVTHVLLGSADLVLFDAGGGLPGLVRELSRQGGFGLFAVDAPR